MRRTIPQWICGLELAVGVLTAFSSSLPAADWANLGPLYDQFQLTLDPGHRTEVLGPFFYDELRDTTRTRALPPLVSYSLDRSIDFSEFDFLYPILTYDRYGTEYRWQLFQVLSFSGGHTQSDTNVSRFTLFPIYFQQRSPIPEKNYTALLPFYGHLKNRLFRDEITFIMFPFYSETRKGDVVTDNYLYPVFHLRHGENLKGWQVWPLVGHETKGITHRTNMWDEVEVVGGHEKFFAVWPFYLSQTTGIGSTNTTRQRALIPVYSLTRSPLRDSTTYFWPFGLTITDDREKKYHEWDCPWPLVVFARGEGKTTSRVWPFFSQAHSPSKESDFYLWPVYKFNRITSAPLDRRRTRILFFLYSDVLERNTETAASLHRVDFWPLFTARRDFNGRSRLQVLALLEPLLPNSKSIERNYSPLWSLWRSESNPVTGAASQSLLWNLYRRDLTTRAKKISLLFGLFQYQSSAYGGHLRLFYIPIGKAAAAPSAGR